MANDDDPDAEEGGLAAKRASSPLYDIDWHRIILDEAHMIRGTCATELSVSGLYSGILKSLAQESARSVRGLSVPSVRDGGGV